MYLNDPSSIIYAHHFCQVCIDHHSIGCLSPEMPEAKQRAGPSVRALLSCNDLQPCTLEKLCKVMDLGTRAGWPMQHRVWLLCENTLLFLFMCLSHTDF